MKVASVIGARPNFIKCAPVSRELKRQHQEILVHTGQHYDYQMNKVFFDELKIPEPDYHLGVGSGTHGYQTSEMLKGIERVLLKEKPSIVLVYGDTNSTLAGALAAAKLCIPLAHIEAGMRRYDKSIPEEINRVLVDHCSNLLFCSTQTAVDNLTKEGIINGVYLVGDVMCDALLHNIRIAETNTDIMDRLMLKPNSYLLATIHRPENTDNRTSLRNIIEALANSGEKMVFSIHPRTLKCLNEYGLYDKVRQANNITPTAPLSYLDFIKLLKNAKAIVTDSGGIQKEAHLLQIPCISVRNSTPWVETVEDGWNVLVDADREKIVREIKEFKPNRPQRNLYGDGKASEKIRDILIDYEVKLPKKMGGNGESKD